MTDKIVNQALDFLLKIFIERRLVTSIISMLPIVELRLGIPIGFKLGLSAFDSWLFAFLGATFIIPLVLLLFMPIINLFKKIPIFKDAADFLFSIFTKRSEGITGEQSQFKLYLALFIFVAVPMPLTGGWTGSAVACVLDLPYHKSLITLILGNLTASLLVLLLVTLFGNFINEIILGLGIIFVLMLIVLVVKFILHIRKRKKSELNKDAV